MSVRSVARFGPIVWCVLSVLPCAAAEDVPPPAADDYRPGPLLDYQTAWTARFGGRREVPLEAKAEQLEWLMWRYHLGDYGIVHQHCDLPAEAGQPWKPHAESDCSTWNGALLAALSYKYGATRDPQTLERIKQILEGLHFFQVITNQPGLPARGIIPGDAPVWNGPLVWKSPSGRSFVYRSDAAKGTVNQISLGYAALRYTGTWDALPLQYREMARDDMTAISWHLARHNYHLTERNGQRTTYGDVTPVVATIGVPFNAQVAYAVIAAGQAYEASDADRRGTIQAAYDRLRHKHHAYYEDPALSLIRPQQIGGSPFVKGMNDRMHVMSAAFTGLMLELDQAGRNRRPPDTTFLFQLGQTMDWGMSYLDDHKNALCNFQWCGILTRPGAFKAIIRRNPADTEKQFARVLDVGIEQLRRYDVIRIRKQGREVETKAVNWLDSFRPDDYCWKGKDFMIWEVTGDYTNLSNAPIDFLHAYWLLRYCGLDRHPSVPEHHRRILTLAQPPAAPIAWPAMEASATQTDPRLVPRDETLPHIQARPGVQGPRLDLPAGPAPVPGKPETAEDDAPASGDGK